MKHNWEYKKLGEVCETTSGGTPSKIKLEYYTNGNIPWLRSGEIRQGLIFDTDIYITEEGLKHSSAKIIPINSVVIAMYGATVGQCGIIKSKMCTNQAVCSIFPNSNIIPEFLCLFLTSKKNTFIKSAVGGAQPNISQNIVRNTLIPLPPLPVQERIVEELDRLSLILEKKKQQIKELDSLAQSIFYDMFGDPIENEKGWEVKKLGEVGELLRGGGFLKSDFIEKGIPCIHYGQIHMKFGQFITRHIKEISESVAKKSKIASKGDIIIAITSEDIDGSCKCTAWLGDYDICVGAHTAIFKHNQNPIYVSYYIKSSKFQIDKQKYIHGIKVMEIKASDIGKIDILLPPLDLQQSFAKKIEAIEKQKELINQSIKEVQLLFDAKMDYYFGD